MPFAWLHSIFHPILSPLRSEMGGKTRRCLISYHRLRKERSIRAELRRKEYQTASCGSCYQQSLLISDTITDTLSLFCSSSFWWQKKMIKAPPRLWRRQRPRGERLNIWSPIFIFCYAAVKMLSRILLPVTERIVIFFTVLQIGRTMFCPQEKGRIREDRI